MDRINSLLARIRNAIQSFLNDLRGVSSVEYALIVVAIIAIVGVGAGLLGDAFEGMFSDLSDRMSAAPAAVSSQAGT